MAEKSARLECGNITTEMSSTKLASRSVSVMGLLKQLDPGSTSDFEA